MPSSSSTFFSCVPPAAIMMFGAPCRRQRRAVDVGVVQEVDVVDDEALLGGRLALEHLRAIDDAGVLLDHSSTGRR